MELKCRLQVLVVMFVGVFVDGEVAYDEGGWWKDIDGNSEGVGEMLQTVIHQFLHDCHLTIITTDPDTSIFSYIIRTGVPSMGVWVMQDEGKIDGQADLLVRNDISSCHGIIIDVTHSTNFTRHLILLVLETYGLWKHPDTKIVVVRDDDMQQTNEKWEEQHFLLQPTFRNTIHALYFDNTVYHNSSYSANFTSMSIQDYIIKYSSNQGGIETMVYERCLYCINGEAGVRQLLYVQHQTNNTKSIKDINNDINNIINYNTIYDALNYDMNGLDGHLLNVLTLRYFPYVDFIRNSEQRGTTVTLVDSLDARLINILSTLLNFTYEIREQREGAWGVEGHGGRFTGVVGDLQREEADFCTLLAPSAQRLLAMDYSAAYPVDEFILTSLKPTTLPQHMAFVRPFADATWIALSVSVLGWSVALLLLERVWWWLIPQIYTTSPKQSSVSEANTSPNQVSVVDTANVQIYPALRPSSALLYGFGALMETPPQVPVQHTSARVAVVWWLLACVVIVSGFRSSLVAHLTVQGKTQPMDTWKQLVAAGEGQSWGALAWIMTGYPKEYFSKHTDPIVKEIYRKMEVVNMDEGMKKVLKGGFSLIGFRNYIMVQVAIRYTDKNGYTPIYISSHGVPIMASFGWGFRLGAPFQEKFSKVIGRLRDTGILGRWHDEVVRHKVNQEKHNNIQNNITSLYTISQDPGRTQVPLSLDHLQGAFYLLILGLLLATVCLLAETFLPSVPFNSRGNMAWY